MYDVGPDENPDWGYARNRQIILKTPLAEFSSSVFSSSTQIGEYTFHGGNRDFSWQGLIVGPMKGELYKTLDALYWSTDSPLISMGVSYDHNACTYRYEDKDGEEFAVELRFEWTGGNISLRALANGPCWYAPILDFTTTDRWLEESYSTRFGQHDMLIRGSIIPLHLLVDGFDEITAIESTLNWRYKLGDGFRFMKNGNVCFWEHVRRLYIPAIMHSRTGRLRITTPIPGSEARKLAVPTVDLPAFGMGPIAQALELRLNTLTTYGLFQDDSWFPEAGAWWFRRPWLRDCLEGLRWNLKTYFRVLGWKDRVISLVRLLLRAAESHEGLPLILGRKDGFSSDAPPQLIDVALKVAELSGSLDLLLDVLDLCRNISEIFLEGRTFSGSVLKRSMICSPANSSWVDSVIIRGNNRWPTRLPTQWMEEDIDPFDNQYGLVEVNALYVEALSRLEESSGKKDIRIPVQVEELRSTLTDGFVRHFKGGNRPPPLTVAPTLGLSDETQGSPSVVALSSLLGVLYSIKEASQIWPTMLDGLMVYRKLSVFGNTVFPFGVIVKAGPPEPYLGDEQYHGTTIWPRDTPYLIRVMENLGQDVGGLLLNHLDHMMSEGAMGYCNELFSLPEGGNPSPSADSANPIPVKNPAQYWSHWCDPYLEHLGELGLEE